MRVRTCASGFVFRTLLGLDPPAPAVVPLRWSALQGAGLWRCLLRGILGFDRQVACQPFDDSAFQCSGPNAAADESGDQVGTRQLVWIGVVDDDFRAGRYLGQWLVAHG